MLRGLTKKFFQFPLLGSARLEILRVHTSVVLSIPSIGFLPQYPSLKVVEIGNFQFPLLGSTSKEEVVEYTPKKTFNSLYWVQTPPFTISTNPLITFNSLYWVHILASPIIPRHKKDFQFPLLGSSCWTART